MQKSCKLCIFVKTCEELKTYLSFRYKAQDIVDFFRNFTVSVVGVGDVCSFAQMDVRRHGHPGWQADDAMDASQQQVSTVQPRQDPCKLKKMF